MARRLVLFPLLLAAGVGCGSPASNDGANETDEASLVEMSGRDASSLPR